MAITKAKQIKKNDIKKQKQAKKVATITKKPQRLKVHDVVIGTTTLSSLRSSSYS